MKVAVTALLLFIVIVAGLVEPDKLPLQPANVQPAAGTAVNVTTVPDVYEAWFGTLVTLPEPTVLTDREYWVGVIVVRTSPV